MSIEQLLVRTCKQTAVYWNRPTSDGYGGMTFDSAYPTEINCRWEDITQVITGRDGKEIVCRAVVYVTEDLEEEGWLYLGELTDLDSDQLDNPMTIEGAYQIKRFDKVPSLGATADFVRKAYL